MYSDTISDDTCVGVLPVDANAPRCQTAQDPGCYLSPALAGLMRNTR